MGEGVFGRSLGLNVVAVAMVVPSSLVKGSKVSNKTKDRTEDGSEWAGITETAHLCIEVGARPIQTVDRTLSFLYGGHCCVVLESLSQSQGVERREEQKEEVVLCTEG